MTRKTSREAYRAIIEQGLLGELQLRVYSALYEHGPMTQGECWQMYFPTSQRHSIAPRFAELRDRGAIEAVGERPCHVTGVNATVWDVTDMLPHEPAEKSGKLRNLLATVLDRLDVVEAELARLKQHQPAQGELFNMRGH